MSYNALEISQYHGQPVELYKFTQGVDKFLYTSADVAITYSGDAYAPELITRTQIDQSQEQQAGAIDVTVTRDNSVAAMFIPYLPITPVGLTIFRKHRGDAEVTTIFMGKVVSTNFNASEAVLSCAPTSQLLQKSIPVNNYQRPCNHALYGPGCNVDKNAFMVSAITTAQSGIQLTLTAINSHADGYFQAGWVERSNGEVRFITGHVGSVLTLVAAFINLAIGETVKVYPGCDRSETTCNFTFNNLVNHLGFARIPTQNPFNGSIT